MYCGEVWVNQISLLEFLQVAKVVGLVEEVEDESKDIKDEHLKKATAATAADLSLDIENLRTVDTNTVRETIILDDMDYYEDNFEVETFDEDMSAETPPVSPPEEFMEGMAPMTKQMKNKKNLKEFAVEILNKPMPRLPCPVQFMNDKQLRDWLLPELYKDIIEQGKRPVRRIRYGDQSCLPLCWPEQVFPLASGHQYCLSTEEQTRRSLNYG